MRRKFIDEAIINAEKSLFKCHTHGAVVIYRGKIVGNGFNKYTTENNSKGAKFSIHAELDAINNALRRISINDLSKSSLIVVRINRLGEIHNSFPCKFCQRTINKYNLKTIYYS